MLFGGLPNRAALGEAVADDVLGQIATNEDKTRDPVCFGVEY
nr:hypothetical protein [Rhizobium sp. LC145]